MTLSDNIERRNTNMSTAFSGIVKLLSELTEQTTAADTDVMPIGATSPRKITIANLKEVLGINALNRNITDLDNRVAGFNSKRLSVSTGKTGIYLKVPSTNWLKCVAFVIGCNNISAVIQETVFAYLDANTGKIVVKTKGDIAWTIDQTGLSVGTGNALATNSELLVYYFGFTRADVF